jgi:hypothetical protein
MNKLQELINQEAEAFQLYKERYQIRNFPPEKISTSTQFDWWEKNAFMLMSFIVTLAIVIGSRTGWSIYEVNKDEGFPAILSAILAVMLVWSVEGFIAYYGLTRPRHLKISKVESNIGAISMVIGLILSAVAGLDYVIEIAAVLSVSWGGAVDIALSLLLSIGLTFILYGISEFAGRARWEHENMPQIEEAKFQKELQEYNTALEEEWKSSPEYMQIMGEQIRRAEELQYDIDHASVGRSKLRRERQLLELEQEKQKVTDTSRQLVYPEFSDKPAANPYFGDGSGKQEVLDCIAQWYEKFGEMPRQVDIVNNTSVSKGYVSQLFSKDSFMKEVELIVNGHKKEDLPLE